MNIFFRRMLKRELSFRSQSGRPKGHFMDVVREDMLIVGVTEEDRRQEKMEENDSLWQLLEKSWV